MMDDMMLEGRAFAWCAERGLSAEKHQTSLASLLIEVRTAAEAEVARLKIRNEELERLLAEAQAERDGAGNILCRLTPSKDHDRRIVECAEDARAEMARLRAAVGAWRKAESAVECEACAVFGANLPEGA